MEGLDQLEKLQAALASTNASEEIVNKAYYKMIGQVCKDLLKIEGLIRTLQDNKLLNQQVRPIYEMMESAISSFCELLFQPEYQDFMLVKRKKLYEDLDDQMAELEDCIEDLNELLVEHGMKVHPLESWDIGLFF